MRFRQVEELLLAFHQTHPAEAARTDRDERLKQLEARALRVRIRMKEGHQARLAIRNVRDKQIQSRESAGRSRRDPLPGKTRGEKHSRRYGRISIEVPRSG